eukprot:CAMPEP_0202876250 /NCGR_PEP_ID=MMETSP1391-20130828/28704_1 /ASSEMBLY_ACC=CAM_ASM_000867 /TAXON_ID=1034604 /ORGANISM="Chlamydomonas leiostraca, Strain SAG 11-49" /LENGTH=306 /DNA_ID=CAMNT_0049558057 /DNA_START=126 /DNA_END=1043 /DNA_ORIENTATION=+
MDRPKQTGQCVGASLDAVSSEMAAMMGHRPLSLCQAHSKQSLSSIRSPSSYAMPRPYGIQTGFRWQSSGSSQDARRHVRLHADAKPGSSQSAASAPTSSQPEASSQPEPEVVTATNVIEQGETVAMDMDILPLMPDAVSQQARIAYTALSSVYGVLGAAMVAAAVLQPGLLLSAPAATPLGATLLGCGGVALIKAAALSLHLQVSVAAGELGTWRHQRLNAVLGLFGAVVAASSVAAAMTASPLLTGLLTVVPLAGAAACVLVAREAWAHGPWLQWVIEPTNWVSTFETLLAYLKRDVTSVAGVIT